MNHSPRFTPQVCHTDTELSLILRFTAGAGTRANTLYGGSGPAGACELLSLSFSEAKPCC